MKLNRLLPTSGGAVAIATVLAMIGPPQTANADPLTFENIINSNDPTFNQALGINNAGTIAGYFGSGMAGHPNQGYTVGSPYGQANFTNENFPSSVQTQVTGINNIGTTVGFWSNSTLALGSTAISASWISAVHSQTSTIRIPQQSHRFSTSCLASTIAISRSAFIPMRQA